MEAGPMDKKDSLTSEQLVLMYLLQGNHLPTPASVSQARDKNQDRDKNLIDGNTLYQLTSMPSHYLRS